MEANSAKSAPATTTTTILIDQLGANSSGSHANWPPLINRVGGGGGSVLKAADKRVQLEEAANSSSVRIQVKLGRACESIRLWSRCDCSRERRGSDRSPKRAGSRCPSRPPSWWWLLDNISISSSISFNININGYNNGLRRRMKGDMTKRKFACKWKPMASALLGGFQVEQQVVGLVGRRASSRVRTAQVEWRSLELPGMTCKFSCFQFVSHFGLPSPPKPAT